MFFGAPLKLSYHATVMPPLQPPASAPRIAALLASLLPLQRADVAATSARRCCSWIYAGGAFWQSPRAWRGILLEERLGSEAPAMPCGMGRGARVNEASVAGLC